MRAVVDNLVGALFRVFCAEVGNTLVGYDHVDRVLAVVAVRHHRYDVADHAALCDRRAGEDRDVGVAAEVAGTSDAVHHACAEDVGGVYAPEYVGFEGGVHGYHSKATYHFGVVGDFGGSHEDFVVEIGQVGEELCLHVVGESHGACAGEFAFAYAEEFKDGVLDYLGVHHEVGELLVDAEIVEHGVGNIAHATL